MTADDKDWRRIVRIANKARMERGISWSQVAREAGIPGFLVTGLPRPSVPKMLAVRVWALQTRSELRKRGRDD